jgi:integrase
MALRRAAPAEDEEPQGAGPADAPGGWRCSGRLPAPRSSGHRGTGIAAPSRKSHLLRHSLATRMVNVGVPIKTIADVLGHASIDTTAIYTKVDLASLAAVALPFPAGGAA